MNDVPPSEAAISAALKQDWSNAIAINTAILKSQPENTDAMNRLGFAYLKTGKHKEAKSIFTKVRTIDPYNKIAVKNLNKLESIRDHTIDGAPEQPSISPLSFLEDPGKTKVSQCVHLAPQDTLSRLHGGQEIFLKSKNHGIELRDGQQQYLGALPDDIAFKLLRMMAAKNKYRVFVKNVDKNALTVLVREVERGRKFAHQPSFLASTSYQPFTGAARHVTRKPDTTATGESDDEDQEEE